MASNISHFHPEFWGNDKTTLTGIYFQLGLKLPTRFASHWFIVVVSQNLRPTTFSGKCSWTWPNGNDVPKEKQQRIWGSQQNFHHDFLLKLTASLHLKMDGWKMKFPFGDARPIFQGLWLLVSRSVATNKRVFICWTRRNLGTHRYWRTHRATSATLVAWRTTQWRC